MVKLRNNFDGGSNGVAITPGGSGGASGDAFTAVDGAPPFTNAQAHSGSLSMALSAAASTSYGRWAFPATKNVAVRTFHRISGAVSATDLDIIQIRVGAATNIAMVRISGYSTPAGALRLRVGATNAWTAPAVFPANSWDRVEALIEQGVAAADGRIRLAYFLGDDPTPVQDSGWITGLALGGDGAGIDSVVLGKTNAGATPAGFMDDAAANTGSDYTGAFIGPVVVPNLPPTANAGPHQAVLTGATVSLNGNGTDPDGDTLTYSWAFAYPATGTPALTGATTRTPTFTAGPTGSIYALRVTVSDGTDSATAIVNIAVVEALGQVESDMLVYDGTDWV